MHALKKKEFERIIKAYAILNYRIYMLYEKFESKGRGAGVLSELCGTIHHVHLY